MTQGDVTTPGNPADPQEFFVEARLAGGWAVRIPGHPTPVTRHDTEEEADAKAAAYRRGAERVAGIGRNTQASARST